MAESFRRADCSKFDELTMPVLRVFGENNPLVTARECSSVDKCTESAIESVISFRLKTKALPLVLRKRLLYQQLAAG